MKSNFDYSLKQVLKDEGGYTNNPSDPGGPTNYGITLADYRRYIKSTGTASDVRGMKLEDAKTIYKSKYWDKIGGDNLPSGVDYCLFDFAVNSGIGRVTKYLKSPLKPVDIINKVCDERMAFLRGLSTFPIFGKGWTSRVSRVRLKATQMATGALKTSGGSVGTILVGGAVAASVSPAHYWPWVLGATAVVALGVGIAIYLYKIRKPNVAVS